MKNTTRWINALCFSALLLTAVLASILPLGGLTASQLTAAHDSLLLPGNAAYLLTVIPGLMMAMFVIEQMDDEGLHPREKNMRERIGGWFALSCLACGGAIFAWHYERMGAYLHCSLLLILALGVIRRRLGENDRESWSDEGFALSFGWSAALTLTALSVWMNERGFRPFGLNAELRDGGALLIAAALMAKRSVKDKRPLPTVGMVCAAACILLRHLSGVYAEMHMSVVTLCSLAVAVLFAGVILSLESSAFAYAAEEKA